MARILVVEDDPAIALGLEDDLRLEGYEVDVAYTGAEGLRNTRAGKLTVTLPINTTPTNGGKQWKVVADIVLRNTSR